MQNVDLLPSSPLDDAGDRSLPLLDRLLEHGWAYDPAPARPVVVGCDVFLATQLVRASGRWSGVLIEWPGRPGIPAQPLRRAIHARVARARRTMTFFTDAAGVREVRGWCTPAGLAPSLYREEHRRRLPPGSSEGPPAWVRPAARSGAALRGAREAAAAFTDFVRLRQQLAHGRRGSPATALVHWLGVAAEPDGVRQVWRGLERFRVLDPAVGDGDWLLGAMEVLVTIGAAGLDRIEGWVEDQHALSPGPQRRGADFARLLNRRDEMAGDGGRDRIVHEMVLLGCLRGLTTDRHEARAVRRRLASRVPTAGECTVRTAGMVAVLAVPVAPADAPATPAMSRFRAQTEMLARAEGVLRDVRLHGAGTLEELREGQRAIARRRSRLVRAVGETGFSAQRRMQLVGGGFHLMRGAEGMGAAGGRARA